MLTPPCVLQDGCGSTRDARKGVQTARARVGCGNAHGRPLSGVLNTKKAIPLSGVENWLPGVKGEYPSHPHLERWGNRPRRCERHCDRGRVDEVTELTWAS
jgi:hypothetical protein